MLPGAVEGALPDVPAALVCADGDAGLAVVAEPGIALAEAAGALLPAGAEADPAAPALPADPPLPPLPPLCAKRKGKEALLQRAVTRRRDLVFMAFLNDWVE